MSNTARYSSGIAFFAYPTCIRPPVRGFLSKYRHPVWYGKTRMVWLPYGEKTSKICLFVLTWSTNVTDRRTDRQTDTACRHRPRLCIASRGKNHPDFNKIWYTRAHFGIDDTWQRYDHIWKFVKFKMADGRGPVKTVVLKTVKTVKTVVLIWRLKG